MENEAAVRLAICVGRYSVISRSGEWRMENVSLTISVGVKVRSMKGEWRIFDNDWCGSRSALNERRIEKRSAFQFSFLHSPYKNIIPHA
jgi:hypothetical protein